MFLCKIVHGHGPTTKSRKILTIVNKIHCLIASIVELRSNVGIGAEIGCYILKQY